MYISCRDRFASVVFFVMVAIRRSRAEDDRLGGELATFDRFLGSVRADNVMGFPATSFRFFAIFDGAFAISAMSMVVVIGKKAP